MKEIKDIKENTADGIVIDAFEGTVVTVYPPKEPTAAQANAGIHRQGIVVADPSGLRMNVALLKERMHMDKTSEGMRFRFESTSGERGLSGLSCSHWQKTDTELVVSVEVNGSATMYALQGSDQPKAHDQTEQKEPQLTTPPDPLAGADNYFGFYRNVYGKARDNMEGSGASSSDIKDITTHYLIGLQQRGELKNAIVAWVKNRVTIDTLRKNVEKSGAVSSVDTPIEEEPLVEAAKEEFDATEVSTDPASEPASQEELDASREKPEEEPVEKNWKKVKNNDGHLICELNRDDLIDLCVKILPFHNTEKPVIKSILRAAMKAKQAMELDYISIYDVLAVMLQNDYPLGAINAAYDQISKSLAKADNDLCFEILKDQKTFKELIGNYTPEEENGTTD